MIYVVAFDPNKILTCWTHQNDSQNLSFVKAINAISKEMARNLIKWPTPRFVILVSKQSLFMAPICVEVYLVFIFQFQPMKLNLSRPAPQDLFRIFPSSRKCLIDS